MPRFMHAAMFRLRHLGRTHGLFAGWLLACVLVMRLALPAGVMPISADGRIVLALCSAATPGNGQQHVTVELPAQQAPDAADDGEQNHCPFAASAAPALAGGGAPDIAAPALLFAEYAMPPPAPLAPLRPRFLTPPLRGPPLPA